MDRKWLAKAITERLKRKWVQTTQYIIEQSLAIMSDVIFDELAKWSEIRLHKFAVISVTQRWAKRWINPITFESVDIKPFKTIRTRFSWVIKKRINS